MDIQPGPVVEPPQPPNKNMAKFMRFVALVLIASCLVFIFTAVVVAVPLIQMRIAGDAQPTITPTSRKTATVTVPTATRKAPTVAPIFTATTAPPKIYKVSERAAEGGIAVTVLNVQSASKTEYFSPKAGYVYLDIEVLIENVTRDKTPYNPMYFRVKDETAAEYTNSVSSLEPSLKSSDLVKGDKVRGHVAFEVPATSKSFIVTYEPIVIAGGYKPIRIDLSQKSGSVADIGTLPVGESSVGKQAVADGIAVTIVSVKAMPAIGVMKPKDKMTLLDVEVLIENVGKEIDVAYIPDDFKIKDEQFWQYPTRMFMVDPSLKSGNLIKGDKVRGHITFEVPATAKKFIIYYDPNFMGGWTRAIPFNVVLP